GSLGTPLLQHRQEPRRTHGRLRKPRGKHFRRSDSRMKGLRQSKIPGTIVPARARKHDRKPSHEKRGSGGPPSIEIRLAYRTQVEKFLFLVPPVYRRHVTKHR